MLTGGHLHTEGKISQEVGVGINFRLEGEVREILTQKGDQLMTELISGGPPELPTEAQENVTPIWRVTV